MTSINSTSIFLRCIPDASACVMFVCRDGEDLDSQGDASSQPDTISIASRTSQNTVDSDKVRKTLVVLPTKHGGQSGPSSVRNLSVT